MSTPPSAFTDASDAASALERVVALAGLGDGSLARFREELASLADELEAGFEPEAGAPLAPRTPTADLDALRDDRGRAARQVDERASWQAQAPEWRDGWLRTPPVRGSGDEDPSLPFAPDEAPRATPPTPPPHHAAVAAPFEDATALAAAIASRAISPREVLAHYTRVLSRDALRGRLDPWNALVDWRAEPPPDLGTASVHGPLHGVPLAVKTNICVEGFTTNCASRALADWRAPYTATCVRRLVTAGAVPFASANMDEFAMGSSGERSAFGSTRNPWSPVDTALVPGGSSSGSAAAVAAGLAPLALGTDAGGSIRQPAALCGISGLRPTRGRLSRFGVVAFSSSFDVVGPVARSARDLYFALRAMDGADPREATRMAAWSSALALPGHAVPNAIDAVLGPGEGARPRQRFADGYRIGVPRKLVERSGLDAEVAASYARSLAELEAAGATLVDVELGGPEGKPDAALSAYHVISCAEAASNLARIDGMRFGPHARGARSFKLARRDLRERAFGLEVKRRVLIGTFSLAREGAERLFERARRAEAQTRAEFARAFEAVHLVALPTSPTTAFAAGARTNDPMAMYRADLLTVPASLAGVAAVSIPGPTGGLPVGLQLIAAPGADDGLLAFAAAYQHEHPHHLVTPG